MDSTAQRRFDDPAGPIPGTPSPQHDFARLTDVPLMRPNPARLSEHTELLRQIEQSGIFSNYGPVNTELEAGFIAQVFGGQGSCVTVCNATIGLMMAIRAAIGPRPDPRRRYALMPSFTFAATAHAAQWAGLTPLLCDIDPLHWLPDAADEARLLAQHGDEVAVVMPYATFGNSLDLQRYDALSARTGIPAVIDAAASLGSLDASGRQFGAGSPHSIVFSMHATKTFAAAEGGLIYSNRAETIDTLRLMGNFGFGAPRAATMPGINSKLGEISALLGLLKLREFDAIIAHREAMTRLYLENLPELQFQRLVGLRQAVAFVPFLLPKELAPARSAIMMALKARGIGSGAYFSPHLAEQPWFGESCRFEALPVSDDVAGRIVTLPMSDIITRDNVLRACDAVRHVLAEFTGRLSSNRSRRDPAWHPGQARPSSPRLHA